MKIGIASDHRGFDKKEEIKNKLKALNIETVDCGTNSIESADFPIYALKLGKKIKDREVDFGLAICKTGTGMSIALNKIRGIMCAKVNNYEEAVLAKEHNHANALAISADLATEDILKMLDGYIKAQALNDEKYLRRIKQIEAIENNEY